MEKIKNIFWVLLAIAILFYLYNETKGFTLADSKIVKEFDIDEIETGLIFNSEVGSFVSIENEEIRLIKKALKEMELKPIKETLPIDYSVTLTKKKSEAMMFITLSNDNLIKFSTDKKGKHYEITNGKGFINIVLDSIAKYKSEQ